MARICASDPLLADCSDTLDGLTACRGRGHVGTATDRCNLVATRELLSFYQEDSMVHRLNGRLRWVVACAAMLTLALASPALAQSTGMIRGVVKDASGKPVEGAKVNIDADANNRHFDTKTDKKGEFLQIGLAPGPYKVTAEKDKVMAAAVPVTVRIAAGNPITL